VRARRNGSHGWFLKAEGSNDEWRVDQWAYNPMYGEVPYWYREGYDWHLYGPGGFRVASYRALWEAKRHVAEMANPQKEGIVMAIEFHIDDKVKAVRDPHRVGTVVGDETETMGVRTAPVAYGDGPAIAIPVTSLWHAGTPMDKDLTGRHVTEPFAGVVTADSGGQRVIVRPDGEEHGRAVHRDELKLSDDASD